MEEEEDLDQSGDGEGADSVTEEDSERQTDSDLSS